MALSVPLSRFTSRVGGGSAFYVRRLERCCVFMILLTCHPKMIAGLSPKAVHTGQQRERVRTYLPTIRGGHMTDIHIYYAFGVVYYAIGIAYMMLGILNSNKH